MHQARLEELNAKHIERLLLDERADREAEERRLKREEERQKAAQEEEVRKRKWVEREEKHKKEYLAASLKLQKEAEEDRAAFDALRIRVQQHVQRLEQLDGTRG